MAGEVRTGLIGCGKVGLTHALALSSLGRSQFSAVCDADPARARDFGARVLEEPHTWEYGERSCLVEDLAGHRWELTQTVRDVEPEEWGGVTVGPW